MPVIASNDETHPGATNRLKLNSDRHVPCDAASGDVHHYFPWELLFAPSPTHFYSSPSLFSISTLITLFDFCYSLCTEFISGTLHWQLLQHCINTVINVSTNNISMQQSEITKENLVRMLSLSHCLFDSLSQICK